MALMHFHPTLDNSSAITETKYPFLQAVIDAKDHSWVHQSWFTNWSRTESCKKEKGPDTYIGLWGNSTATTVDFTKNINLPESGLYRIEIKMDRGPQQTGNIKLFVDSTQQGNQESGKLRWALPHRIVYPTTELDAGTHTFKVTLKKPAKISDIIIYKIRRFTGGTDTETIPNSERLEIKDGTFTQNSINEINTLTLNLAFREDYYDPNNHFTGLKFDYTDSVSLYLGEHYNDTKVMFGGYITGVHLDHSTATNPKLSIDFEDRLFDLQREPLYNQYMIALANMQNKTTKTVNKVDSGNAEYVYGAMQDIMRKYSGLDWDACDCFCASDLLFNAFKKAGIPCKIVYYRTSVPEHRSVMINLGNGWIDAPYREFGYDRLLNNTSKSKTAPVKIIDGVRKEYQGDPVTKTKEVTKTYDCVTATMWNSCGYHPVGFYQSIKKSWINKCPFCGGPLSNNPKHVDEGEWTCKACDADFCGYCGKEKLIPYRKKLTPCPSDYNTTTGQTPVPTSKPIDLTKYVQFASIYEATQYLAAANEYDIKSQGMTDEYGFIQNFDSLEEINTIRNNTTLYRVEWDTNFGNPRPSLKLGYEGSTTGTAECVLYEDQEGYDAGKYPLLHFGYYSGGKGKKYPIKGNLKINMHKLGETIADTVTYTIKFTAGDTGIILDGIKPKFNGTWHNVVLDLDKLFDKKAASSEHHVTKISFKGVLTANDLAKKTVSGLWLDTLYAYKKVAVTKTNTSADIKTPFENLQELCEKNNFAAYVQYAPERRDDILVIQPNGNVTSSEPVLEGYNVLESITSWDYTPKEDGLVNMSHKAYNITDSKGEEQPKHSFSQELMSKRIFGPLQSYESVDSKTQASADQLAYTDIIVNSYKYPAFTVKIKGCTLLEPAQYVATIMDSKRINGVHIPKSITHDFNLETGTYTTSIDFNKPSNMFMKLLAKYRKDMNHQGVKTQNSIFSAYSLGTLGTSSTGAFTK